METTNEIHWNKGKKYRFDCIFKQELCLSFREGKEKTVL